MLEVLLWLEQSSLGETLRSAGVWTYGIINMFHILGISLLFGAIAILDLRMMGLWRRIPLDMLATPCVPMAGIGFVLAIVSGICMLSFNATEYLDNLFMFRVKLPALCLAIVNIIVLQRLPAWQQRQHAEQIPAYRLHLALSGGASLLLWLAVIAGGRMIGYW